MNIQLNSDNHLSIHQEFAEKIKDILSSELDRYSEFISRIEVHLSDENGPKRGTDDKRCLLEARMEGRSPIAVSHTSDNHETSLIGAVDKLKASLSTIISKLQQH